ncbi:MFS transporter [Mangrovibacterium lignilyticum]|uniref:MFS transporter n=1 Tax=Mangrovibacterium lignilyticum TaxID=2668052 RepID=UPI0013D4045F|nr:MFS transporter [Mangrovibacterium lignilyticum]
MTPYKTYRENPMYHFLILLVVASAMGFQGWRTLFNNFAVDVVGVNSVQIGMIQSVREIPGFLTFFVVYLLLIFAEHRFASFSVILLGIGVFLTGLFPSFRGLLFTIVVMSVGFHFFETCNQSLSLQYFEGNRVPQVLAKLKSFGALTNVAVGGFIWIISKYLELNSIFYIIGGIVIILGTYALTRNPVDKNLPAQQKKLILKKKYWLFYVLNFLSGARRQIFVVFAVFILVEKYHFSIGHITTLFVINNIITYFLSPYVGKAINHFGERTMLTIEYSSLIFVFLGYALVENRNFATGLYVIDNLFFSFSIAINSFFRKYAEPRDIAPSMAVGFTINHISAVVLPVVGGLLWTIDWRIPFIAGAIIAITSLSFTQYIRTYERKLRLEQA